MRLSFSEQTLLNLLADGQFHSKTELVNKININATELTDQLKNLVALGLEFIEMNNKGCRLKNELHLLSKTALEKTLYPVTQALISRLEIHHCIDSTNRYLVNQSQQTPQNGLVCFAESQTAGKGRRGRDWVSPFGCNIYLSILWIFPRGSASVAGLSLAVGVAVIRALHDCGINHVGLKWPNDIYWQGKKLAGILIEASHQSNGSCHAVIGLGLNVYLPEQHAKAITQEWVDLNHIMADHATKIRNKVATALLNNLMPTIAYFAKDTLQHYLNEWRRYDCMQGKTVNIYQGQQIFTGIVIGIDDNGLLLLRDQQGNINAFASGEVSFRQT